MLGSKLQHTSFEISIYNSITSTTNFEGRQTSAFSTKFGKQSSSSTQQEKLQPLGIYMASTTRLSFSFNLSTATTQSAPKPKSYVQYHSTSHSCTYQKLHFTALKSIDVSKEDKPVSEGDLTKEPTLEETTEFLYEEPQSFDKRRLEEKFAVLNTGVYECRSCGYNYDEAKGDPSYPVPPGLPYDKLPDDWRCPTCGASKSFFQSKSVEIAGFAENQQFGLGGNTLTSGQKALLIYGGLLLGFLFFLSGYFLQ